MSSPPVAIRGETVVRPATPADLDALLRLYVDLDPANATTDRTAAEPALAALLATPGAHILIAESDGRVVGTVTLVVVPNLTHSAHPWAQIENMVVAEEARGTGAGRALLHECERIARAAGSYKLQLQSANRRDGAQRFYEAGGFIASSKGYRRYLD